MENETETEIKKMRAECKLTVKLLKISGIFPITYTYRLMTLAAIRRCSESKYAEGSSIR